MFGESGRLIICLLFLTLFCDETSSECTQLTPCSCMFSDGQGYDLSPLRKSRPLTVTSNSYTFYFQPCSNTPLSKNTSSECYKGSGVSLCAEYDNDNNTFSLGTIEETSIGIESDKVKTPSLTLRHGNYTTTIGLTCCDLCKTQLVVNSISGNKEYHLFLISPHACKTLIRAKGLSTGSILLIYFFVITGIYFIGGAIALKLLRGATGWEMIPNLGFWQELQSLVKDGITFTFNCCRVNSYDRI